MLLDAHALLWFLGDHPHLSSAARTLIADQGNHLLLSVATCWEIAIKVSLGKLKLSQPYGPFMQAVIATHQIELLPIGLQHVTLLAELPFHHRDPFDRLLAIQAIEEKLPIVSIDKALDAYGVQRLW